MKITNNQYHVLARTRVSRITKRGQIRLGCARPSERVLFRSQKYDLAKPQGLIEDAVSKQLNNAETND